ncbi:MAG: SIS domain-containing protein [Patescibacteria group bacterium]
MYILDDINRIKKLDKSNMIGSIDLLYKQIEQALAETKKIKIPADYKEVDKVVVNGMGGSGLGTHIIQSLFFKQLKVSLGNIHGYDLPGIIDKNTLYIISSYSGSTEEPLSTVREAKKRGAKLLGITTGGKLGELIEEGVMPGYLFKPKYNICDQPRIGIGYSVAGILGLLWQSGVIKASSNGMEKVVLFLKKNRKQFNAQKTAKSNLAKQIAGEIKGKIPVIIIADFLAGNAHTMANQINENAKNFSSYYVVSELNHHLMEGLSNPKSNSRNLKFIFIESDLYHKKNKIRIEITKNVVRKNKIGYVSYKLEAKTRLEQSFEMLLLGSYVSFYLAILNGVNPAPIPWVDYFKEQLAINSKQ